MHDSSRCTSLKHGILHTVLTSYVTRAIVACVSAQPHSQLYRQRWPHGAMCRKAILISLRFDHQGAVTCLAYAANGSRMAASCAGGAVLVWEACPPSRASLGAAPRHRTPLNPTAALASGESAVAYTHAAAVAALAFDAAGRLLASAAGAELALSAQRGQAATRLKARLLRCRERSCLFG